uniref:CAP-Gly domain-containing protein n=1 Tax=Mesocestoides corti TaxID=53468 RepID=A0A5K3ETJ0_MESCO
MCFFAFTLVKDEKILLPEIRKISSSHNLLVFLVSEQIPPNEKRLHMFKDLVYGGGDPWGAITLVTTKRQAENLGLATFSLSTTDTVSKDNWEVTGEAMQKWLDDQAILASGTRDPSALHVQPKHPAPRPAPRQRSSSKHTSRRRDRAGSKTHSQRSNSRDKAKDFQHKDSPGRDSRCRSGDSPGKTSYAHQSRSSSRDRDKYYGKISQRPASVQSTTSSINSAGSLLLGRHVLVPRRDHGNQLYLGVIKTQKKDKRFGVVFCIPYGGHGDEEGLEYCFQDVDLDDILSYSDLYRHAIRENDDVLVPAALLEPRKDESKADQPALDPPYAGQPYVLAVVHKGCEPRSSRGAISPTRKTSSLTVKVAGVSRPRLCEIPLGCALWISAKQAQALYNQGWHFFESKRESRDASPFREEKDSLCMHGAPNSPSRRTEVGEDDCQQSCKSLNLLRTESNTSDGFSVNEKRSQSSSQPSGRCSTTNRRPKWQYWGRAQIPDLLDPPSHEPYIPMRVFGPTALANSQPGSEWPATHFAIVNRSLDNLTSQNDSTRVYEALRQVPNQPLAAKSADLFVTRSLQVPSDDGDFDNPLYGSVDCNEDGLTGLSLRELYRRRFLKTLREAKTNSAGGNNRRRSITKSVKSQ